MEQACAKRFGTQDDGWAKLIPWALLSDSGKEARTALSRAYGLLFEFQDALRPEAQRYSWEDSPFDAELIYSRICVIADLISDGFLLVGISKELRDAAEVWRINDTRGFLGCRPLRCTRLRK